VFERFTDNARLVVVVAQDEARMLKHNYIGTEHILLGLLGVECGTAARVLESLDVTLAEVRAEVARIVGQGDEVTNGQIPFTPRARKVLELSLREAVSRGDNYIGTEHLLLATAAENEGVAARVLLDFDVNAETLRREVTHFAMGKGPSERARGAPLEPVEAFPPMTFSQMPSSSSTMRLSREVSLGGRAPWWSPLVERVDLWFGMLLGALLVGVGLLVGRLIWG